MLPEITSKAGVLRYALYTVQPLLIQTCVRLIFFLIRIKPDFWKVESNQLTIQKLFSEDWFESTHDSTAFAESLFESVQDSKTFAESWFESAHKSEAFSVSWFESAHDSSLSHISLFLNVIHVMGIKSRGTRPLQ